MAAAILSIPALCLAQALSGYVISTVAGSGTSGFSGDGGGATNAQLNGPTAVAVAPSGAIYIADQFNYRVRSLAADGTISTVAGSAVSGYSGDGAAATSAELHAPSGLAVDGSGNYYIADTGNNVVRKVTSGGTISTVAGNNGLGAGYSGDLAAATAAQLNSPTGLALDSSGNLYIADSTNNRIRKVGTDGNITTIAGTGGASLVGDGGPATIAGLNAPRGVAVDSSGNLYIADSGNNVIRKVAGGIITTVAGTGKGGFGGDGGPATSAQLWFPVGIAVDSAGDLFIADYLNSRIREVTPNGIITTIAGNGKFGLAGDGGPAVQASLFFPSGVALDSAGHIYVADNQNNVVRLLVRPNGAGEPPSLASGTVISAGAFGAFKSIAPGSWIEIYGSNLAANSRSWATSDFKGPAAPTSLDGTRVNVAGVPAYVSYISANQVNAQVPSGIAPGTQTVTVTTPAGTSGPFSITVNPTQPGLFAPPSLNLGGKQYVAALFGNTTTYVLPPGAVQGITSRQAKPGDVITLYGIGFGTVTPNIPAGQVAQRVSTLTSSMRVFFAQTLGVVTFEGLAPGAVGLYQFNVVVPNVAPSDAVPLTFTLNGISGGQTLYTAVQN